MPPSFADLRIDPDATDASLRANVCCESIFSAYNGVFMGLSVLAAPVVAVTAVGASPLELTILVAAFPVGVFFGPAWAGVGRRIGMQRLVTQMAVWANLPLFVMFWVESSGLFTALVAVSQVLHSGMRMGQSSLYHALYPRQVRGRVLGRLTFWTFLTMVPSILITGWLLDKSPQMYRVLYPLAGLCGLIGAYFYSLLRVPTTAVIAPVSGAGSMREGLTQVAQVLTADRRYLLFQVAFFLSGSSFFMAGHVVLLLVRDHLPFSAFDLALWLSVMPQLMLAVSSPFWGPVLDRIGIVRCRLVISVLMTTYLASYLGGVVLGLPLLIYVGSVLQGVSNGGGQLTWSLASSHFAPRAEDVPVYNGIHFVLNGIRGLVLPWVGSVLWVLTGPGAVLVATLVSFASIPVILHALRWEPDTAGT